jgi:hypothetical protein
MSDLPKTTEQCQTPNRRDILLASTALAAASITVNASTEATYAQSRSRQVGRPTLSTSSLTISAMAERKAIDLPYIHSWTAVHFGKILKDFALSVRREPLIPAGALLDHVPRAKPT